MVNYSVMRALITVFLRCDVFCLYYGNAAAGEPRRCRHGAINCIILLLNAFKLDYTCIIHRVTQRLHARYASLRKAGKSQQKLLLSQNKRLLDNTEFTSASIKRYQLALGLWWVMARSPYV
jgi:hypothetical protein